MNTEEFVKSFYTEKQSALKEYLSESPKSEVGHLIKSLNLTDQQKEIMKKIMDGTLTDIFYTILLGLDGCNPIGNSIQQQFTILDENKNQVCGREQSGEVEAFAYEYFQENKNH